MIEALPDERARSRMLLDVLIRAALVFALAALCYRIFSPFLTLMVWALILAVAIFPLHQRLARRLGGRQGLAATIIAIVGAVVIVWPSAALLSSLGDSVRDFVARVNVYPRQVTDERRVAPAVVDDDRAPPALVLTRKHDSAFGYTPGDGSSCGAEANRRPLVRGGTHIDHLGAALDRQW